MNELLDEQAQEGGLARRSGEKPSASSSDSIASPMNAMQTLRNFFDRRLSASDEVRRHLGVGAGVSRAHLIDHLVERTVRRASVDAATQRTTGGETGVSWRHCLMVAALAELRPLRLLARQQI